MAETPPNPANLKPLREALVQTGDVPLDLLSVAVVGHPEQAFVGGNTGKIYQLDLTASEKSVANQWEAHVSHVSGLLAAGEQLISCGSDHRIVWWERSSRRQLREVVLPKWVRALALAPDGQTFASTCDDMVCRQFETGTGKLVREFKGHAALTPYHLPSKLYNCRFSRDGRHLATVDQGGHAMVWEVATGKQLADIHAPFFYTHDTNGHTYGGIRTVDFSPDGKSLALGGNLAGDTSNIGGSKSLIQIYDWQKSERTHDLQVGGNFFYERIRYHHEGKWLLGAAGAGSEQKLVFFDLAKKAMLREVKSTILVFDLVLTEQSDTLYAVGPLSDQRPLGRGSLVKWSLAGV